MDRQPPSENWRKIILPIADVLGILLAFTIAYWLRFHTVDSERIFSGLMFWFVLVDLFALYLFSLYQFDAYTPLWKKPLQTLAAVAGAGVCNVMIAYLAGSIAFSGLIGRGVLIGAHVLFALWALAWRFFLSRWVIRAGHRTRYLVIGTEENLTSFLPDLLASRIAGHFSILTPNGRDFEALKEGQRAISQNPGREGILTLSHQGSWSDLERLAKEPWTAVIVCAGNHISEELVEVLMEARLRGMRVVDLADFYEQTWLKVPVYYLQRSWFAMAQGFQLLHNPVGLKLKRIFDVIGSLLLLIFALPIMAIAAIIIKLESPGPVVFRQTRVGENGRTFTVYKLRSMRQDAEKDGAKWAQIGDSRITRIGGFLRATRIDELPQLINVLRGEMSFVGPRPERPEFTGQLEKEIPFYNLRHLLRPGVTGWAQVMYPYGASVEDARQKLQYELFYIKNYSLLLDAAIVLKTVRVVLFGSGR